MKEFELVDPVYTELHDITATGSEVAGQGALVRDVFGFYLTDGPDTGEELSLVFKARQAKAAKSTGTGKTITAGDHVFFKPSTNNVSNTRATGDYRCGTALENAGALDTTVLIEFDGSMPLETV